MQTSVNLSPKKDALIKCLKLLNFQILLDFVCSHFFSIESPLLSIERYLLYTVATYYFIKSIKQNYQRPTFEVVLFLAWICIVLLRSIPDVFDPYHNHVHFKQLISGKFFTNIIPFVILIELKFDTIKKFMKLSYQYLFVYLIFVVILFNEVFIAHDFVGQSITVFASGIGILAMTYSFQDTKHKRIIWLTLFIVVVTMMLIGRRSVAVYYGAILFFSLFLNFNIRTTKSRPAFTLFLFFCLASFIYALFFTPTFDFFWYRMGTGMDSREGIIDLFIEDFNSTPNDWIFGRGIYGTYYGGMLGNEELGGSRDGIENGYLNHILYSGYIYLILLVLVCLRSLYLGFFKSQNILCKGMACIILIYFIDMIGFGLPSTSLKYMLIFISIAGTRTKALRKMSNRDLVNKLSL